MTTNAELDAQLLELEDLLSTVEQLPSDRRIIAEWRIPMRSRKDLKSALILFQSGRANDPKATIRKHIIAGAKALGLTSMLPDDWSPIRLGFFARRAAFASFMPHTSPNARVDMSTATAPDRRIGVASPCTDRRNPRLLSVYRARRTGA